MALPARTTRRLGAAAASLIAAAGVFAAPGVSAEAGPSTRTAVAAAASTPPGVYGLPQQWGVQGFMQDGGTLDHSDVQAFTESNGMMFAGGNFARVQKGADATGADRIEQPYLAAFTVDTATFVPAFRPTFNDEVHTLATLPDGTVLAGGSFTQVNGVASPGIVALNPSNGQIASHWRVRIQQRSSNPLVVRDIEVRDGKVFIAGSFSHVGTGNGTAYAYTRNLAQVTSATNPVVNVAFRPQPNAIVNEVSVSPDASMLYLAGRFTGVLNSSGQLVTATKVTGVRTVDGLQQPGMAAPTFSNSRNYQQAVEAVGSRVYYGGAEHMLFGVDPANFQRKSASITQRGGDIQVIEEISGGVILAGCHCYQYNYQDATTYPIRTYSRRDPIRWVGAWDAVTGAYQPQFVPIGVRTRDSHGAWAIEQASNGHIWVGGDFTGIQMQPGMGTRWTGGFFRLPHTAAADTTAPSAPGTLTATAAPSGTQIDLSWGAASDNVGVTGYQVQRDGSPLATVGSVTTYVDTSVQPGTSYSYVVRALDAAGNAGPWSNVAPVATPQPPPPGDHVVHTESWTGADGSAWPTAWETGNRTGAVDIQGNAGRLEISSAGDSFARATLAGVPAITDTDLVFSYRWSAATPKSSFNVFVRGSGGWQNANRPRTGYGLNFVSDTGRVTVQKNVDGVLTNVAGVTGAQPVGTDKGWVRLRVVGSSLMFRTWADGAPEPAAWTWSGTDASVAGAGSLYLTHVAMGVNASSRNVRLDDLVLTEVVP